MWFCMESGGTPVSNSATHKCQPCRVILEVEGAVVAQRVTMRGEGGGSDAPLASEVRFPLHASGTLIATHCCNTCPLDRQLLVDACMYPCCVLRLAPERMRLPQRSQLMPRVQVNTFSMALASAKQQLTRSLLNV
jgi:hypothetical protein